MPANRIGFAHLTLPQLKMLQEVITLSVFVPFSIFYMHQPLRIDFLCRAVPVWSRVFHVPRLAGDGVKALNRGGRPRGGNARVDLKSCRVTRAVRK